MITFRRVAVKLLIAMFVLSLLLAARTSALAFSGSITFVEHGGKDTYQVFIKDGKVISGWVGTPEDPRYAIVGGWYDGKRLVYLYQKNGSDIGNRWYSGARHLERSGNKLIMKYDLSGFCQAETSHFVPFDIIEIVGH